MSGPEFDDTDPRACRICGCTDEDCEMCIALTGEPCSWISEDLCSACAMFADPNHRRMRIEECLAAASVMLARALNQCVMQKDKEIAVRLEPIKAQIDSTKDGLYPKKRKVSRR